MQAHLCSDIQKPFIISNLDTMYHLLVRFCTLFFICILLTSTGLAGGVNGNYYVKATATGTGDGSSWTDAITNIQVAIDLAEPGDVICVAAGTYFPTLRHGGDAVRFSTFYINKDIIIYGGFSGEPGTEGSLEGRDPKIHITTLTGDLGVVADHSDNAFHVVYFDHVSDTARLDGFIITHGNTVDAPGFDAYGAGVFINGTAGRSNPTIANCLVQHNNASETGGGLMALAQEGGRSNPVIINCVFAENESNSGGGLGFLSENGIANPTLINCTIKGNKNKNAQGSGLMLIVHSGVSIPRLINCEVYGNFTTTSQAFSILVTGTGVATVEIHNSAFAGNKGGAIRLSNLGSEACLLKLRNSIFFGNTSGSGLTTAGIATIDASHCVMEFTTPENGNIGLNPEFVLQPPLLDSAHTIGDLRLQTSSLAIDAGNNSDVPAGISTDILGKPRFINALTGNAGIVDMGPYETQKETSSTRDFLAAEFWNIYPNPAHDKIVLQYSAFTEFGIAQIYDLHGRLMQSYALNIGEAQHAFDVSGFTPGVYVLQLILDGVTGAEKITITEAK